MAPHPQRPLSRRFRNCSRPPVYRTKSAELARSWRVLLPLKITIISEITVALCRVSVGVLPLLLIGGEYVGVELSKFFRSDRRRDRPRSRTGVRAVGDLALAEPRCPVDLAFGRFRRWCKPHRSRAHRTCRSRGADQ